MHVMDARTDIIEVAALLVAARTIVADPARWCAWPHALDPDGLRCEGRASCAVRWGALGALDRAAADASAAHDSIAGAASLLNRQARKLSRGALATAWVLNENAPHSRIVAMFDRALKAVPKPETPTGPDILTIARTLIAHPDRWAQGAIALDRWGRSLISFEGGCRFCAAGAVGLAAHVLSIDDTARRRMSGTVDHVANLLDCAAYKIGDYESHIGLNEHDTHARVVAMFDHALDMTRAQRPTRRHIDTELAP